MNGRRSASLAGALAQYAAVASAHRARTPEPWTGRSGGCCGGRVVRDVGTCAGISRLPRQCGSQLPHRLLGRDVAVALPKRDDVAATAAGKAMEEAALAVDAKAHAPVVVEGAVPAS